MLTTPKVMTTKMTTINKEELKAKVEQMMPDWPTCQDEYRLGQIAAYRSVLDLLDKY